MEAYPQGGNFSYPDIIFCTVMTVLPRMIQKRIGQHIKG